MGIILRHVCVRSVRKNAASQQTARHGTDTFGRTQFLHNKIGQVTNPVQAIGGQYPVTGTSLSGEGIRYKTGFIFLNFFSGSPGLEPAGTYGHSDCGLSGSMQIVIAAEILPGTKIYIIMTGIIEHGIQRLYGRILIGPGGNPLYL
jgi:hypothetical protein